MLFEGSESSKHVQPDNDEIQSALSRHYGQPFSVSGERDYRVMRWISGPQREEVWMFIAFNFPALAIEAMVKSNMLNGMQVFDGHVLVPIPPWFYREDFFDSPIEDFPRLLTAGCDPSESDAVGITPLEYALGDSDSLRAIALAEAGASVEQYLSGGVLNHDTLAHPAFAAYLEFTSLNAGCPNLSASEPSAGRARRI